MSSYLDVLQDELRHAENRLAAADQEALGVIQAQIRQIKRDIFRNSTKNGENTTLYILFTNQKNQKDGKNFLLSKKGIKDNLKSKTPNTAFGS